MWSFADLPVGRMAVMGIINVTPDSFSDGGDRLDPEQAIAASRQMVRAGADLIDIGGETTRPGSAPTSPDIERSRILPVIRALAGEGITVSVDTRHADTMAAALAAGAHLVNDVSALADPAAAEIVAASGCPVVLMHMRGTPMTMQAHAVYGDVVAEVMEALAERIALAVRAGIDRSRIAIDPGLGFAKTGAHNLELLRRLRELQRLGCPILVGASRKNFIGHLGAGDAPKDRLAGSLAAALFAAQQGARMVRVHDVAETVQALRVWEAIGTSGQSPANR
jgi:dihydropteroate synthase